MHTWLLGQDIEMRGVRVQQKIRSGHGDQNSEKHPKNNSGFKKNWPIKNLKIWKFGVVLTWDRSHDTFTKKKHNKT